MRRIVVLSLLLAASAIGYLVVRAAQARQGQGTVLSVTMNLSAMGVESDTYPSITATLDFEHHTSRCQRSYYDPAYPSSSYHLPVEELNAVRQLLQQADLKKLKVSYSTTRTDQPTSTTMIRTTSNTFTIRDYGLRGDAPLPELYRRVYKFEY